MVYPDGRKLVYGWDANGNRTSLTAHLAGQVLTTTFTYDALNHLDVVTDPQGQTYDYGYDANGNRTSLEYPNGVHASYRYDTLNRLRELQTRTSVGAVVQGYVYTLGAAGNRTRIDEADGTVRSYGYDALYRLTSEEVTTSGATVYSKAFAYDPVGNRLQQVHTSAAGTVTTAPGGWTPAPVDSPASIRSHCRSARCSRAPGTSTFSTILSTSVTPAAWCRTGSCVCWWGPRSTRRCTNGFVTKPFPRATYPYQSGYLHDPGNSARQLHGPRQQRFMFGAARSG